MAVFKFSLDTGVPPVNVEDWRQLAVPKLPEMALTYLEGGADDRLTVAENMSAFRKWRLRIRSLTGITDPGLATRVAGTDISMPVAIAPVGAAGLSHWTADVAAARAAESCGTRMTLSTASSYSLEEVAQASEADHWFQLYPIGGREWIGELMQRACDSGYTALFVTVDVQTLGNREGERRWNQVMPWTVTPSRAFHLLKHWRWVYEALRHKRLSSAHFLQLAQKVAEEEARESGLTKGVSDAFKSREKLASLMQGDLSWDDVAWMREQWKGPFYIKGVLDPDDAARSVDEIGAEGVVVSNHGGRQLDRCLASVDALPAIAERIGDRAEVYLDGGVRRGTDVITALCLGAKGVFVGRPYLYGLIGDGENGVRSVLEIFREEIKRNLVLMGCPSVADLDRSWLIPADPC